MAGTLDSPRGATGAPPDPHARQRRVSRRGRRSPADGNLAIRQLEDWSMPFDKTDGMIRHTRLENESREYLERREELRRAEVELIRQSEKVAALRRSLPQGTAGAGLQLPRGTREPRCRRCGAAGPLERAVQHADETAAHHLSLHVRQEADAAVPDVHDDDRRFQRHRALTSRRTSISPSSLRPNRPPCGPMHAPAAGGGCVSSARGTARSNTICAARTPKEHRIRRHLSSRSTPTARSGIATPTTPGSPTTCTSAARI